MTTDVLRTACVLCGAKKLRDVYGEEHFIVRCGNCRHVTTREIPSDETLSNYYHSYPSYGTIPHLTLARYHKILDLLEPYRRTNNLLESGCGFGFFLEEARKRKWNVFGTELSAEALKACAEKNLAVSDDPRKLGIPGEVDMVISIEVIEHLRDPVAEVEMYRTLLRSGGAVYVTTPNFNSLSRLLLNKKWNVLHYPEHIHYFTLRTIDNMFTQRGFTSVSRQTVGFSPARLTYAFRKGRGHDISDYDYNEKDRELRDAIEKTLLLRLIKKVINAMLSAFKLGDTLKILYTKK